MHEAVMEVADEEGAGEGLLLHLAYSTDQGFAGSSEFRWVSDAPVGV
jgi:alpha-D-ribose 1-methylphosphonate 5-triphosphate synthase subunit PhnI